MLPTKRKKSWGSIVGEFDVTTEGGNFGKIKELEPLCVYPLWYHAKRVVNPALPERLSTVLQLDLRRHFVSTGIIVLPENSRK